MSGHILRNDFVPSADERSLLARRLEEVTQELLESREELHDFMESAAVCIHSVGPDGTILQANDAELKMLGYARDEYVGRPIADFHEDRALVEDMLARLRAGEVLREVPARMLARDGSVRDVIVNSSGARKNGQFARSRCFTRDVTDARRAREASERLAAIVESSEDAIISKSLDGTLLTFNRGAERLFGYPAGEMVGKSVYEIVPPGRIAQEREILDRLARGEQIRHYVTERLRKDGSTIQVSLTISPIRDQAGRVVAASSSARDISERVHAERRIRELNEELERRVRERTSSLEQLVRELDTFTHTVAHDLRAPLRSIHAFGQILLETRAKELDRDGAALLSEILHGTKRMDALVLDLLKYCRVSREELKLKRVELDQAVSQVLRETQPELELCRAEVSVARPLPAVLGDDLMMSQALTNLVLNASKFTRPGTTPRIAIRAESRTGAGGPRVRLWIEDDGVGIAPQHQSRLFRVFERLHPREEYPGTGIGLAIVRRAAERMEAEVGVESDTGAGSRFYLDFRPADALPDPENRPC